MTPEVTAVVRAEPGAEDGAEAPPAALRVVALTHRGAVRPGNEDALVVGGFTASEAEFAAPTVLTLDTGGPVVVAVADGLGGHAAGEVAATYAVRRLAAAGPVLTGPDEVAAALVRISAEIEEIGCSTPSMSGLGTTVAGLVVGGPATGLVFHVGDSRVYQVNGPCLGQLTTDDSPLGNAAADPTGGELSGRITQFLGGPLGDGSIHPHVDRLPVVEPGTRWLLCTDGLSDLVPVGEMEGVLAAEPDDVRAVRTLWATAMNAGGRDNITIALVTAVTP